MYHYSFIDRFLEFLRSKSPPALYSGSQADFLLLLTQSGIGDLALLKTINQEPNQTRLPIESLLAPYLITRSLKKSQNSSKQNLNSGTAYMLIQTTII